MGKSFTFNIGNAKLNTTVNHYHEGERNIESHGEIRRRERLPWFLLSVNRLRKFHTGH